MTTTPEPLTAEDVAVLRLLYVQRNSDNGPYLTFQAVRRRMLAEVPPEKINDCLSRLHANGLIHADRQQGTTDGSVTGYRILRRGVDAYEVARQVYLERRDEGLPTWNDLVRLLDRPDQ